MIELTRVGSHASFLLNPDLIERIDTHVDTVVRLTNGIEYVVAEDGHEIVARIVDYRARIMNALPTVEHSSDDESDEPGARTDTTGDGVDPVHDDHADPESDDCEAAR